MALYEPLMEGDNFGKGEFAVTDNLMEGGCKGIYTPDSTPKPPSGQQVRFGAAGKNREDVLVCKVTNRAFAAPLRKRNFD